MTTITAFSASKVIWGLYRGCIRNGYPWFNIATFHKIVPISEKYFIKKYPHQLIIVNWNITRINWLNNHMADSSWNWTPLGKGKYLFGFKHQEDAILFKTTWY